MTDLQWQGQAARQPLQGTLFRYHGEHVKCQELDRWLQMLSVAKVQFWKEGAPNQEHDEAGFMLDSYRTDLGSSETTVNHRSLIPLRAKRTVNRF